MKSIPPRPNIPAGAQPKSAALKFRTLHFKIEDFEKAIQFLPDEKQKYARKHFPKDATGLWIKTDVARLEIFSKRLDSTEQLKLKSMIKKAQTSVYSGRMSYAATAKLKDSGRFTPEPAPQAGHSAQGADLHTPPGSPEARPQSMAQALNPGPSEKAQGKLNAESPKPSGKTLADFLAEDKPGQDSPVSLQTQAQPVPAKGVLKKERVAGTAQEKPNAEASKPKRVNFAEEGHFFEYPPEQDSPDSPRPILVRQNARRAAEDLGTAEGTPTLQRQNARREAEDLGTAEGNQAPQENGRIKNFVNSLTPSDKVLLGSAATAATLGVVGLAAAGAILVSKDGDDSSSNASDKT